jgi:thiamine-monophosphate kinase
MTEKKTTLAEVGEGRLLALIAERIGSAPADEVWAGDDAAIVGPASGKALLTTDLMVEGADFDLAYISGYDIGWKLVQINLSDIAAMGGTPRHAVTGLAVPPTTEVGFVEAFLDGLIDAAAVWDVGLVGGDISSASQIAVSMTLMGEAYRPVRRDGAQTDDAICVTGCLGGSAGGLRVLRSGHEPGPLDALTARHLRPRARVAEGRALAAAGATAMIDISDGFALDLLRLMRASGTGCAVDPERVPVDPGLDALPPDPDGSSSLDLALYGGEDFELLFTMPASAVPAATGELEALGTEVTMVGTVTARAITIGDRVLSEEQGLGWDHLRNR